MDLKALLLIQGVIAATCFSTFVAARQLAPEPSASSPSASSSSSCSRALATTLWGAAFAFFSLTADAWPASKVAASLAGTRSCLARSVYFLLLAPVAPFFEIGTILTNLFTTLRFRQILRSSINPELAADATSMSNKSRRDIERAFLMRTRIVANTYIVLGTRDSSSLPHTHIDRLVEEKNIADALTVGHKTAEHSCLMQLNDAGKLALLESSILPNYKQLWFLDGRSGIATLIIGVQAIGYVTSIVYRAIHHLPVSPIEAIGFAFSLLVIVCSLVHSVGLLCQSPLVIYLNHAQEREILDKCKSTQWSDVDSVNCGKAGKLGMVVVGSVVVAFTILVEWHVLRISWLDAIGPILFLLSLITQSFASIMPTKYGGMLLHGGSWMISFGGIVVSIVATILNWQRDKFDSRTPSVIHNLPFLG